MTHAAASPGLPALPYRPAAAVQPTPAEVAAWTGGILLDASSAPDRLTGLATLDAATPREVSFIASAKYEKAGAACAAGLMIVPHGVLAGRARVEVAAVWPAVVAVMERLYPPRRPAPGIHPTALLGAGVRTGAGVSVGPYSVVGDGALLGEGAVIGPHCSIDAGCEVGAGSRLHASVTLQGEVVVGARVILHPGVVLGADGFRYEAGAGGILKIPQVGRVVIEDEVEIGANTCIDRPFLFETRVGFGSRIDNLNQIGHNCNIGRFVIIAGCCAIAGSVTIEDGCILGGQSCFAEGLTIGAGSMIGGGSGVIKSCPPGSILLGRPAIAHREHLRALAHTNQIPRLIGRIKALEDRGRD